MRGLDRGVLRDAIGLMHGWSRVIARSDGLGHIFRVRANVDQELLTSALTRYMRGTGTPASRASKTGPRPAANPAGQHAAAAPGGGDAPRRPLPAVKDAVGKVGGAVKDTVGKVDDAVKGTAGKVDDTLKGALNPLLGHRGAGGRRAATRSSGGSDALRLFDYLFGS
jgi:hypothetical protein